MGSQVLGKPEIIYLMLGQLISLDKISVNTYSVLQVAFEEYQCKNVLDNRIDTLKLVCQGRVREIKLGPYLFGITIMRMLWQVLTKDQ